MSTRREEARDARHTDSAPALAARRPRELLPDSGGTDGSWTVNPAPNPGRGSNILGGVTTIDGQLWATGVYDNGGSEIPLVEHR